MLCVRTCRGGHLFLGALPAMLRAVCARLGVNVTVTVTLSARGMCGSRARSVESWVFWRVRRADWCPYGFT